MFSPEWLDDLALLAQVHHADAELRDSPAWRRVISAAVDLLERRADEASEGRGSPPLGNLPSPSDERGWIVRAVAFFPDEALERTRLRRYFADGLLQKDPGIRTALEKEWGDAQKLCSPQTRITVAAAAKLGTSDPKALAKKLRPDLVEGSDGLFKMEEAIRGRLRYAKKSTWLAWWPTRVKCVKHRKSTQVEGDVTFE